MCSSQNKKKRSDWQSVVIGVCAALLAGGQLFAQGQPSQSRLTSNSGAPTPTSENYGRVVLDQYSSKAGLGPVVFDHWLHRAKFTCRLCHADLGFAMQSNTSGIRASTNRQGFHCGACHDGKREIDGHVVFRSCSDGAPTPECARCHSGNKTARNYDYDTFTASLPKNAYGVDWEEAEAIGRIKPIDILEGVSIKKAPLKSQEDLTLQPRVTWVSDIIFSHRKHTVWNGCEVCHPEIFPAAKKGVVRYTMFHISGGQYCGVCHGKVAFPTTACSLCHNKMENKEALRDVVALPAPARAAGFGGVKFMHKTHVGDHNLTCETCHHPPKGGGEQDAHEQVCSKCHTRDPEPPVKTPLRATFHNPSATAGLCIGCHKSENAKNFDNDMEFARSILPHNQAVIDSAKSQLVYGKDPKMRELAQEIITDRQSESDQMEFWLKEHNATSWAPVKCRDCHKKANLAN